MHAINYRKLKTIIRNSSAKLILISCLVGKRENLKLGILYATLSIVHRGSGLTPHP